MASNLLFKAMFVRGELDDFEKRYYTKEDIIKTDCILENVFSYLLRDHYNFNTICKMYKKEKHVFETIKETLNFFRNKYGDLVKILCSEMDDIDEDTVDSVLLGVAHALFSEGITWSRIIAFFHFVGELTITCIIRKLPNSLVDVIYECFSKCVKVKLESWIEDHDGWEGVSSLSVSIQEHLLNISKLSCSKSLLYATRKQIFALTSQTFKKH